ncbi:MAG: hypothetical protein FWF82_04385, partial [Oscillospiraceae bacterium]|nr:hypothetical protein [Oscillospiraceae bacterium]
MKEIIIPIGFALFILIGSIYSIRERLWFRKHGKLFDVRIISIDERVRYNTRGGKISTYILRVEFLDGEVCEGTVTYDGFGGWRLRVGMITPADYNPNR